ncbi:MAG: VWA domain-containing protein, partial [Nannocystaceae bacterium]|nr:VWA domain-containing protein [Nannocystaceae bacterium]
RMANALEAARGMVRRLRVGDSVSVVTYNASTQVLVPATTIDERTRGDVLFSLRGVEARGHTCISCGLEAGVTAMARRSGAVNRMLLLSDGEANFGVRDVDGFRRIAESARASGISISTIGVDVDYNERVMFAVAQASTGRHYFVENAASLPRIFDEELSSLVNTVVNDAQVEVDLAPGVTVLEVLGRSFSRDGNRLIVPFGSFAAGETKTLLVRVRVPGGTQGDRDIADVRTRYDDLAKDTRGDCQGQLVAQLTTLALAQTELDPIVEARLARSETAASLTRANELFSRGDAVGAQRELGANRGRIRRRKASVSKKSKGKLKKDLGGDFENQLKSLEEAERTFNEAPAPSSRAGKAQVRSNAGQLDELLK